MNVPRLRFPEFSNEWEIKKLRDISEINPSNKSLPDSFIYIDLESVSDGELTKEDTVYKSEAPSRAQRILQKEDIIFQTVRPYQKNNLFFDKNGLYVASTGYAQIRTKETSRFLYQYLHFQIFVDKVIERCTGTSYPAINSTDLSNIQISFPKISEQQKIASFLTSVDSKRTQLKKKKTLLEQYKKGAMEKLLLNQLRFKNEDGSNYPKWESKKLGEVAEIKRGAASQHLIYVNNENEGVRFLRINDFLSNEPVYVKNTVDMHKYTVKTNDLLMAGTGATAGIIFIVPEKFNELSYSYNAPRIRVNTAYFLYIYYYLNSNTILRQQKGLFVGNAQHFLDTDAMRSFKIALPCLQEQTKIANFLSAIDEKINNCQKQIEKTELWKKGLLQKMFC